MKKESRFVIEVFTTPVIPKHGNFRLRRHRAQDDRTNFCFQEDEMKIRCLAIAAIGGVLSVSAVQAHHSHGNYDTTKWTTMEGKVTELHLLVPHSWLYVEVKDEKGESTVWAMEATGYGGLQRVGIKREDVK